MKVQFRNWPWNDHGAKNLKRYRWITVPLRIRNRRDKKKFRSSFRSVSLWSYLQQINNHFRITNVGSAQRGAWAHEIKFHDQTNKYIGTMMIKKHRVHKINTTKFHAKIENKKNIIEMNGLTCTCTQIINNCSFFSEIWLLVLVRQTNRAQRQHSKRAVLIKIFIKQTDYRTEKPFPFNWLQKLNKTAETSNKKARTPNNRETKRERDNTKNVLRLRLRCFLHNWRLFLLNKYDTIADWMA